MKNSTDIIINNFSDVQKTINSIAETESQAISASFSSIIEFSPELLKNKSADCRNRITDKIFNINFIKQFYPEEEISEKRFQLIKYNFRQISSIIDVPFPNPMKQLKTLSLPILALTGAVIGMLSGGFLFRFFLGNDYRQFGIMIGAAAGSFLCTLIGIYLSKHELLLRIFQGLFGAAVATEIITLFTGAVNPVSILWRKLTGRFGGGIWGKIKPIGAFILGILILQIAVPEEKIPHVQLQLNSYSAIKLWLEQSVKILILIVGETKDSIGSVNVGRPEKTDIQLLRSLVKLANHKDSKEAEFISQEIMMAFTNAGYEIKSNESDIHPIYSESLKKEFDVEGYINDGDEYKVFEMPLYKNDELIIRGKLTKKR